jgi:hypothetical protein
VKKLFCTAIIVASCRQSLNRHFSAFRVVAQSVKGYYYSNLGGTLIGWDRGGGRDLPRDPRRGAVVAVTGDRWLEDGEKAILVFQAEHLLEGYRRLAFMRLDADVVTVSPSSVYRVLRDAGLRAGSYPMV